MYKKKIQKYLSNKKDHKFTRKIDFNIVRSKLITMTKLNHFLKNQYQIKTNKKLKNQFDTT